VASFWTHYTGYHAISEAKSPVEGRSVCKSGKTTGWTCGRVNGYTDDHYIEDAYGRGTYVDGLWTSTMCALGGDSRGAVVEGNYAVGVMSATRTTISGFAHQTSYDQIGTYFPSVGLVPWR
jgi:hypothetical protein